MKYSHEPRDNSEDYLNGYSLVEESATVARDAIVPVMGRRDPLRSHVLADWGEVRRFLSPDQGLGLPTKCVILGLGGWSILLTDARIDNGYGAARAVDRLAGCRTLTVIHRPGHRQIHYWRERKRVRLLNARYQTEGQWTLLAMGEVQPWEEPGTDQSRLPTPMLHRCLRNLTGISFPLDWEHAPFDPIFGLELVRLRRITG